MTIKSRLRKLAERCVRFLVEFLDMEYVWNDIVKTEGPCTKSDVHRYRSDCYSPGKGTISLQPGIVPTYKGIIPDPLVVVYDYLVQTFESGYTQHWITGRDKEGAYYAVKMNPHPAFVNLQTRDAYEDWLQRYCYYARFSR